jgi:hypothetical protein
VLAFHREGTKQAPVTRPRADGGDTAVDRAIHCAVCYRRVTSEQKKIEVAGAHAHVFTNPAGFTFDVRCFAAADCRTDGAPSTEATWFAGWAWQCVLCIGCRTHLGWRWERGGDAFYGLIADRLVD